MKKIVVTGAGGYIGRHVVNKLCEMGAEVTAVDIKDFAVDSRAKALVMNIFDNAEDKFELFGRPDAVVHLAWRDGFIHNSDSHMGDLSKHYSFLKSMINSGLKQVAVMGTMHEVGYFEGEINDDTPCDPISMYGIAKDALRRSMALLAQENGICLQWLRAFYIYGDDKYNHSIFAKLTEAEENGNPTFPLNSGKNKYDFIHIVALAEQIAAAVMQDKVTGIINCCSGTPTSLGEKIEQFISEHNFSIRPEYGVFPARKYDSPAIWGNAEKIQRIMSDLSDNK
ncbi:MAG: NAD(P)-dependent oxidoreductase [Oscillospiraceae bacterium]|nr:NAD(P)-dependent oxidoreductase [Oscillospiraceae bacterium]